jgi:alpha-L-rhamnosidase
MGVHPSYHFGLSPIVAPKSLAGQGFWGIVFYGLDSRVFARSASLEERDREWSYTAAAMRRLSFLLAFASIFFSFASAQMAPELARYVWSAHWITSTNSPQRDQVVLRFRKFIDLGEKPEHFVVQVSADNQFIFYVNGEWAGAGPAKGDLGHWRYETYDIAPLLKPGKNILAAVVWNFGVLTPLAQISDRTGFVLHGASDAERIADTNDSWEVEEEKGIVALPTPAEVARKYYVSEPAEKMDGRLLDWDWQAGSAGHWSKAKPLEGASVLGGALQNDNWPLVPDPLPAMQMEAEPVGKVVRALGIDAAGFPGEPINIPAHSKVEILIDSSHLTTAYPELTVSGGRDAKLRLIYAESLFDDKGTKGNRNEIAGKHMEGIFDEFIADGGQNRTFMPLAWKTWRYLQLNVETANQSLQIEKLRTWFTAYPFVLRGRFESDNDQLKAIWDIGWRTARLDAHDTYMDTPYYERMQYVGDTRIQALISYTVAGDDRLARQAIQAFNDSRIPEGLTRSRYPSSVRQIIPTFSLLWVGMVHDFWMYRDDPEFVRAQLAGTRTVLDWFLAKQRADGLLGRIDWWPFVDWGSDFVFGMPPQDEDGGSSIITLQFVEALRYAAEMELALGDSQRATEYRSAANRAAEAIYRLCWNNEYGLLADTPAHKHFSQHANILGVWLDIVPPERQKSVLIKTLAASADATCTGCGAVPSMTKATYYFRFYLARAIDHAGMGNQYLSLLTPWKEMVIHGLTTWAESPEPTRSDSHAWSAHPNYDLLTIVAGVRPNEAGFKSVRIEPQLGNLKHVSAAMPHPRGMIETEYTVGASGVSAKIQLPSGVSGELVWKGKTSSLREGMQTIQLP